MCDYALTNAGTATPTTLRLWLHSVGAHAASVIGPAFVSFWQVGCKGLGTGIGCKPAHSGDRQGRKMRCLVWLPQWPAVLVFMTCPSRGAVRLKR